VKIDLIVRGICCLRPGIPEVSDRIRVVSIVGRFLEHSRLWHFANGGEEEFYVGSADWMPRNFDRRVEAVAPVDSPAAGERLRSLLATYLEDNRQAWDLDADGNWHQRTPDGVVRASHERLVKNSWGRGSRDGLLDLGRVDVVGGEHPSVGSDDLDRHTRKVRQ
jgi:polyphosphate kinase